MRLLGDWIHISVATGQAEQTDGFGKKLRPTVTVRERGFSNKMRYKIGFHIE